MTVSFLGHGRFLFIWKRFYHRAFAANSILVAPALADPGGRILGVFMAVAFRVTAAAIPRSRMPGVLIAIAIMVAAAFMPAPVMPGMVALRPIMAMMVLMGKDGGGGKQQACQGQDGKNDFLPMSRHERVSFVS